MSNFNKSMSLYFPRVPVTVTPDQFESTIISNNFGTIRKIDVVSKTHHTTGENFNSIFVHFETWIENELNTEFQKQVRDPNYKSIVYTTNGRYWHVNEHIPPKTQPKQIDSDAVYKLKYTFMLELVRATETILERRDAEIVKLYREIAVLKGGIIYVEPTDVEPIDAEITDELNEMSEEDEDDLFKPEKQLWREHELAYFENLATAEITQIYREYEIEYMRNQERLQRQTESSYCIVEFDQREYDALFEYI